MLKLLPCAIALAAASMPAVAAPNQVFSKEIVRYDDLNLASPAGARALERRINAAAQRVCGFREARLVGHILPASVSECMDQALQSARQQVAAKTGAEIFKV